MHHLNLRSSGPVLVAACLPGEQHELGMLFFALAAVDVGYRIILLGADMPLVQIPEVLAKRDCAAVVLSGSARPKRGLLTEQLPELVKRAGVPVFVGGLTAVQHHKQIEKAGAVCVGAEIQPGLQRIQQQLASAR
jgi:cobalamin-dependent methionine synthase I